MDIFDRDHQAFGPQTSGLLDLRFGNAGFLAPYWTRYDSNVSVYGGHDLAYSYAFPTDLLKTTITDLHNKIGNAVTANKHVVVGVGASQIIQAALFAMKKRGIKGVYAKAPYFPRFAHFSEIVGLSFGDTASLQPADVVEIHTTPNNPDNSRYSATYSNLIKDCCYNWPQYNAIEKVDGDVLVFSMAKATGHASTRIGWALVKDKAFADDMNKYIEVQSCGVSVEALALVRQILLNQTNLEPNFTIFKNGSDKLRNRWERVRNSFTGLQGVTLLNDSGMFLWGKTDGDSSDYFNKIGVLTVNGDYFGMSDRNHFRLNIGTDVDSFLKLIKIIDEKKATAITGQTTDKH